MDESPACLRHAGLSSNGISETIYTFGSAMLAPPLLVSYSKLDDYLSALPAELRHEYEHDIRSLVHRGLPPVVSSSCLAILFGFSVKFVNAMHSRNSRYYREFSIRKGKKNRKIQAPKVSIKVIQKWFGYHLVRAITVSDSVYGFVPGRSAIDAAKRHCGANWVYSVDIKDFFPTTYESVVKEALIKIGYSVKSSDFIVPLCCYGKYLAQGSPASPVLSNLALSCIDQKLEDIAKSYDLTYTRYVDDIVFSGSGEFPEAIRNELDNIFEPTCWKLSKDKEYLASKENGQRLKVHGVLVKDEKVRLTKGYRNKIRAYRHLVKTGKVQESDLKRILGHLNYADSVEKNAD